MKEIRKVLVANRGEIAVRVIRTLRDMGIQSVSVFSDADASSPHVFIADEAIPIGGTLPSESYLQIDRIIEVALDVEADAIHPGYGFLSENPTFARKVREAGLIFIGPSPESISLMGDKHAAHALAREIGVATPPGGILVHSVEEAREAAQTLGYPILLKAAGGGGGKGMRRIHHPEELETHFVSAQREAKSSFHDDRILVERWIEPARHIEVQVLADQHGGIWILGERECSLQRRYQKIVEETPSIGISQRTREKLWDAARSIARAAQYTNAGTVEFLVDQEENIYFMEMNTRLQVEHPITEMVWGVDLVAWQIDIAKGEHLPPALPSPRGHAIEARVYAEDPDLFLPSTGMVRVLRIPHLPGLRVDHALEEGLEIHPYYDPLLAKFVTWGEDRDQARQRMIQALESFVLLGFMHNGAFLIDLFKSSWFQQGQTFTTTVEEWKRPTSEIPPEVLAALLAFSEGSHQKRSIRGGEGDDAFSPWKRLGAFRIGR